MRLIIIRSQILEVASRWKAQYPSAEGDKLEIQRKLEKIDLNKATPEDIEQITGNRSWVCPQLCNECEERSKKVIEIGEALDYESSTARICTGCLEKALKLIEDGDDLIW